jgi:tRNA threonylcarbamoyladenosine biosynthesis protein TsaE
VRHCFHSRDADETRAAARALAGVLSATAQSAAFVIALQGELGAGKTVFVKGLADGLAIDPQVVSSPTFVLANQYAAANGARLNHVDMYRLNTEAELETIGFTDLLEPGTIVAIEWADRFPAALPADRLEIRIVRPPQTPSDAIGSPAEPDGEGGARTIEAEALGPVSAKVLDSWCAALAIA